MTPAVAAGLEEKPWSLEKVVEMTADYICGEKRARRVDYGAGGGSFIGVSVSEGVGDACGVADCNSTATGAVVVSGVGELRMDDVGDACDAVAPRSLENGISAIRATSIGTITAAATTAHRVQCNILRSRPTDSV